MGSEDRHEAYSIGALAKEAGCAVETVRYYEKRGLIGRPARQANGRRVFERQHLWQLRFIRTARGLGLPLERIRGVLAAVQDADRRCDEVQRILQEHHLELQARLGRLLHQEQLLRDLVRRCRPGEGCHGRCHVVPHAGGVGGKEG